MIKCCYFQEFQFQLVHTIVRTSPRLHKRRGWDFSKMAIIGGSKIFIRNWGGRGGSQKWGGWQLFKVSLSSWKRGYNPPILWRPTLYCLPPLFHIFSNLPSPHSHCSFFLWLKGWWRHIWCFTLLNDNRDLHMSSLGTLVPEGHWCLFYAIRRQVYWGLTH